jgi:BirA family biotin operon repressor/biotin-[acetyl-CoA-carboxylase] ligase
MRVTASTNDRARELAGAGAPHGTLVTAGAQTAGRGRHGRRWSAPAGAAVLMSLVLREPPKMLPLAAALAVCDVAGEGALIKWPNDVVVVLGTAARAGDPGRETGGAGGGGDAGPAPPLAKLAGILVEARPAEGWAVLGIGLNVAVRLEDLPAELRPGARGAAGLPAATLGLGREDVEPCLQRLIGALALRLAEEPDATLAAWRRLDALRGRPVSWADGSGTAAGIDGEGRLVVELGDGGHTTIAAGEVHLQLAG